MILFEGGKELFRYEGKKTADDFVAWLQNPAAPPPPPPPEKPWSEEERNVLHLGKANFAAALKDSSSPLLLVMFYAPWCGSCPPSTASIVPTLCRPLQGHEAGDGPKPL